MISSNTRARAHKSIFKYGMAFEEKLTHQRVAWSKLNCPKGQVAESENPLPGRDRFSHRRPAGASTSFAEFLGRETGDWG